ncbi:hypothetical protein CANARDRAFT_9992 [[Candida] arabinofermentans NRRL YB-2248]|uniref:J domain-containing protein n=1 Tax=[Candida] arabinofermentans NRRL YB-2248 TaxID=983967 RepID=A0A1E4SU23_9ASCO|nr:hypothetical protein CANARDRAFT_9992 [[Candida] arabinofermentans NRRL YB-2248]
MWKATVDKKDYEWLLTRSKSAYDLLGLDKDSINDVKKIRKAYRSKALILHPDKNKNIDADLQFREVFVSYCVLTDSVAKVLYDEELQLVRKQRSVNNDLASVSAGFKESLKNDELRSKMEDKILITNREKVVRLKKEAELLKRRKLNELVSGGSTFKNTTKTLSELSRNCRVKWRNKVTLSSDDIRQLLQVFGDVEMVKLSDHNNKDDKFHYANVIFKNSYSCVMASINDYTITGELWDGLGLRKIASLLRKVSYVGLENDMKKGVISKTYLTDLDYIVGSLYILHNSSK